MEHSHDQYNHDDTEYVRGILQQNYWIIGLRNALRSIKQKHSKFRKRDASQFQPAMADLPVKRVAERVFPFTNTRIDYFGPFEVKVLLQSLKLWCCYLLA